MGKAKGDGDGHTSSSVTTSLISRAAGYVPGVFPLLHKHGAKILVADYDGQPMEVVNRRVYVVLRFTSHEVALEWYNDPAYESVKKIPFDYCENNHMVLPKQFVPPAS